MSGNVEVVEGDVDWADHLERLLRDKPISIERTELVLRNIAKENKNKYIAYLCRRNQLMGLDRFAL